MTVDFTVYAHPEPQGSKKAFVVPGKNGNRPRAVVVDDNKALLKTYRQEITRTAMTQVVLRPWATKHVAIRLKLAFWFQKPDSAPKSRLWPSVKPDIDKLVRSTMDGLTGVLYLDDAQVCELLVRKSYGDVERVRVYAELL